jgi:hypothetical protein
MIFAVEADHSHTYRFYIKHFSVMLTIANTAILQNFEVISDQYEVVADNM